MTVLQSTIWWSTLFRKGATACFSGVRRGSRVVIRITGTPSPLVAIQWAVPLDVGRNAAVIAVADDHSFH